MQISSLNLGSASCSLDEQPQAGYTLGNSAGPKAVQASEHRKNILVLAFGAFDRYYICWADDDGEYHQGKSRALHRLPYG